MDSRAEVRDFLTTRRARITPAQAGLPTYGTHRRVSGLRREEVAMLAGVSVDYYTRLERGNLAGASASVLESLVRALQLDEAERAHLFDLARAVTGGAARRCAVDSGTGNGGAAGRGPVPAGQRRGTTRQVRPGVRQVLDALTLAPAYVRNGRLDILATNALGRAVFAPVLEPASAPNLARFLFLDPAARDFYVDWERSAADTVAVLRAEAGRDPYDRALSNLVGELSTRSGPFRAWWATHDVLIHRSGVKHLHHPVVGELPLAYESLELTADTGLRLNVYTAEPGSPARQSLDLLASWTATPA